MLHSMTAYASDRGGMQQDATRIAWDWDMRAVNGRGLDVRLRLPEGLGFLEKPLRDKVAAKATRGTVTIALKLHVDRPEAAFGVDRASLGALLDGLKTVQAHAADAGVTLAAPTALDILNWRGFHGHGQDSATIDMTALGTSVLQDFDGVLTAFCAARADEGAALARVLRDQVGQITALVAEARAQVPRRDAALRAAYRSILDSFADSAQVDAHRLEQELALLAVKADLTEELDRIQAHCAAATGLLDQGGAVGRKLDFLTQEFNREANTLCAKAQHLELTRIGLALKSVIDQMREQVQNVE